MAKAKWNDLRGSRKIRGQLFDISQALLIIPDVSNIFAYFFI